MISLYVGPVDNPCPPGTASTYTTELGRHCVDLYSNVSHLATTGGSTDTAGWITAGFLLAAGGLLVWYNNFKRKE